MTLALQAMGVTKRYPFPQQVEVLRGVDLEVNKGELVAIMGASGEGKSTLLNILGTLEAPTDGTVCINSEPVHPRTAPTIRNQLIGFIFQAFHLLEDYTTLDNVLMPARIGRKRIGRGSSMRKRGIELLEQVGLAERADFPAKLLSGGEKQRAGIARALINDPMLVLADEPSGNLDSANSQAIHQLLLELVKEKGKTLVVVTHDPALAALCNRSYQLRSGQLCDERPSVVSSDHD